MTHEPYLTNLRSLVGDYTQEYLDQKVDRFWPYRMSRTLRLDKAREHSPKSRHLYLHSSFWPSRWKSFLGIKLYPNAAKNRQDKQSTAVDAIYDALTKDLKGDEQAAYNILNAAGVNIADAYPSVTLLNLLSIHKLAESYPKRAATEKTGPSGNRSLPPVPTQRSKALDRYLRGRSIREIYSTKATREKQLYNMQLSIKPNRKAERASGGPKVATSPKAKDPIEEDSSNKERRKNRQAGSAFRRALVRSYRYVKKRINQGNSNSSAYQNSHLLESERRKAPNLQSDRARASTALKLESRDIRNADMLLNDLATALLIEDEKSAIDRITYLDKLIPLIEKEHVRKDDKVRKAAENILKNFDPSFKKIFPHIPLSLARTDYQKKWTAFKETFLPPPSDGGPQASAQAAKEEINQVLPRATPADKATKLIAALRSNIARDLSLAKGPHDENLSDSIKAPLTPEQRQDTLKDLKSLLAEDAVKGDDTVKAVLQGFFDHDWPGTKEFYEKNTTDLKAISQINEIVKTFAEALGKDGSKVESIPVPDAETRRQMKRIKTAKTLINQLQNTVMEDISRNRKGVRSLSERRKARKDLDKLLTDDKIAKDVGVQKLLNRFIKVDWPEIKNTIIQNQYRNSNIVEINKVFVLFAQTLSLDNAAINNGKAWTPKMRQNRIEATKNALTDLENTFSKDGNIDKGSLQIGVDSKIDLLKHYLKLDHVRFDASVRQKLHSSETYYKDRLLDSFEDAGSIDTNNEADANKEASAVFQAQSLVTGTLAENVKDAKRLITQLGRKVENDINAEESSIPAADELQPQAALEALQLLLEEEEVEQSEEVKEMLKGFIEDKWPKFKEFCTEQESSDLDRHGEEQFNHIVSQNNRIFETLAKAYGYYEAGIINDVYRSPRQKQKDIQGTTNQLNTLLRNIKSGSSSFAQIAGQLRRRSLDKLATYLKMSHVLADEGVQKALADGRDYYTKFLEENGDNKDNNVPVAVLKAVEGILEEISTALDLVDAARQESALQPEAPKLKQKAQALETVPENTSLTIDSEDAAVSAVEEVDRGHDSQAQEDAPEQTEVVAAQSSSKRNADSGDAAQALDRLLGELGGAEAPSVPPNTGDALTEVVAARSSSKRNVDSGEAAQVLDSLLEVLDKTEVPPVEKAAHHDDKSKAPPQAE